VGASISDFFDTDKVKVDNCAMDERSSKSFVNEGRWQTIVDKLQKGDYVFIQFGHNDEKREKVAQLRDVPLIDMAKKTSDLLLWLGVEDSKRLYLWLKPGETPRHPNGLEDNTHFSEYGAFTIIK
jgi:lysophospholipase L1-like esterase